MTTARRPHLLAVALLVALIGATLVVSPARADEGLTLVDRLGTTDRDELRRVVAEVERAPTTTPDLDEALFSAARVCEDTLADPARAVALYDRLVREFPDARRSSAAKIRADLLRARVGATSTHAREATELAQLVAESDRLPAADVLARAQRLAQASWPGAPEAALWLAEWLRRNRRFAEAQARYADVATRWPDTPHAIAAIRGGAGNAIDAHDWDLAERLANTLPTYEAIDRVMREELLQNAAQGRRRDRWYVICWIALALVGLGLVGSLLEAKLRGRPKKRPKKQIDDGTRDQEEHDPSAWMRMRPPVEVAFLIPVAAVLVGVALTTHELIAPAVFWLSLGGIALTWISGVTLETLRTRGRVVRTRALAHAIACVAGVAALLYILLVRDNLLDMLIETVRFGPSG